MVGCSDCVCVAGQQHHGPLVQVMWCSGKDSGGRGVATMHAAAVVTKGRGLSSGLWGCQRYTVCAARQADQRGRVLGTASRVLAVCMCAFAYVLEHAPAAGWTLSRD